MVLRNWIYQRRRASVIIVVLVTIMLASLMLMRFIDSSTLELLLSTRQADRDRLRADAYSALELTLSVINEVRTIDNNQLFLPSQGWEDPYSYAGLSPREGVDVSIQFEDESGKLSLPQMGFADLSKLAEVLGLETRDAERFADAMMAWKSNNYTPVNLEFDGSNYEHASLPYTAAHRSLRSWDEVSAVDGVRDYFYDENGLPTYFGELFKQNVSLYSFDSVNINSARPDVLTARNMDDYAQQRLTEYLSGKGSRPAGAPDYLRTTDEVQQVLGGNVDITGFGTETHLLWVMVTVHEGASVCRVRALVTTESNVSLPDAVALPSNDVQDVQSQNQAQNQTGTQTQTQNETQSQSATSTTQEVLNYPFTVLELIEDNGSGPLNI